jgi:hypothetical protein
VPAQPSSASPYSTPPTWPPGQRRVYADGYSAPPPNVSANFKHLFAYTAPLLSLSHKAHSLVSHSLSMYECHVGFMAC